MTNANGYGVCRFSGRDESELATATALGPNGYETTDPVPITFGPRTEGVDQRAYQSTLLFPGHSVRLWRLNETIGQTVHDEFGGGLEGTISDAVTRGTNGPFEGQPAMGLSRDGTVDFGNNVRPSAEEFTVEAYVKLSASAAGGLLFYNHSFELSVGQQGRLIADVVDNAGHAHVVSTHVSLTDDRWHHVAFTRTYHPGSDTRVKLYVDGARVAQTEDGAATGGTSDAVLGGLDGAEIADLAFYRDVALKEQAIRASAAVQLSRPGFGQTKAPWRDLLANAVGQRNEANRVAPSALGYYEQIINLVCAAARSTNKNCKSMEAATHQYKSPAWAGDWIWDVFRRFLNSDSDPRAVVTAIRHDADTYGNVIEISCSVIFRLPCGEKDFGTAEAGVAHFAADLKPGFIQATRRALDEYGYGDRGELVQNLTAVLRDIREQHNGLFVNAVQPGFDAVFRKGLIGPIARSVAQRTVAGIAACMREQAFRQALRDKFGAALGDTYYLASGGVQYRDRYFYEGGHNPSGLACQGLWYAK